MKITEIRTYALLDPGYRSEATSSAQDDFVVEIFTDEGVTGIGESDINAWIALACVEAPGTHTMDRGLGSLLIGLDPMKDDVWTTLYRGTAMSGRRGALVHALGAIDMAIWDIRGKVAGVPVWSLLGERSRDSIPVYASLQPEVTDVDGYISSMVRWGESARSMGYRAVKAEATFSGPYANMGLSAPDDRVTEVVERVRSAIGPEIDLMIDVQYAFDSVDRAASAVASWRDSNVYFIEAPLWSDDVEDYAELARRIDVPIASGEWLGTVHEFDELVRPGGVAVVQPDIGRVGGFTQALRVTELAARRGLQVVPHVWKTGISVAAAAHLAVVTPHMPFFEYLPPELCESRLRRELVADEAGLSPDGTIPIPSKPGLGVEIDRDALEEFAEAGRRAWTDRGAALGQRRGRD